MNLFELFKRKPRRALRLSDYEQPPKNFEDAVKMAAFWKAEAAAKDQQISHYQALIASKDSHAVNLRAENACKAGMLRGHEEAIASIQQMLAENRKGFPGIEEGLGHAFSLLDQLQRHFDYFTDRLNDSSEKDI